MDTSTLHDVDVGITVTEPRITDFRDLCLAALADSEAELADANRQLVDLVGDLAFECAVLRTLWADELRRRLLGDATIARLQRHLHCRAA